MGRYMSWRHGSSLLERATSRADEELITLATKSIGMNINQQETGELCRTDLVEQTCFKHRFFL